ncbi:MAG: CBS domain-containing protein [Candidatus Woesearchaeota archaeon]|nr:CBS domain-containing protein [Candidatus Woesearchaeota archaeon]
MIYLSHLLGRRIADNSGKIAGILEDLIILDGEKAAEVTALVCRNKNSLFRIPISYVTVIEKEIKLSIQNDKIPMLGSVNPDDLHLKSAILDKQLIDTEGLKVIRVNDVALANVNGKFSVIGVDAGFSGFLRRLGVPKTIGNLLPEAGKKIGNIISWEFVAPLEPDPKHLHLKIERKSIHAMHPADLAELMGDLSDEERVLVLKSIDNNMAADALAEAEPKVQKSIVEDIRVKRIIPVLEKMTADEVADMLSFTNKKKAEEILSLIKPEIAKQVKEILKYPEDTAGALMTTEFIAIPWNLTAEQTINKMREIIPTISNIYYLYVTNEKNELVGVLSLRQLIIVPPQKKVCDFMNSDVAKVELSDSKQHMAKVLSKYNLLALPVVDSNNILKGVVTAHDIIENVMPESWSRGKVKKSRVRKEKKIAAETTSAKSDIKQ